MDKKIIIPVIIVALASAGVILYFQVFSKNSQAQKQELSDVLNIYNWVDYFGTSTIEDFEKEFGVKVNLDSYDSEDTMLSAVQSDPSKYDIAIASDILVREMAKMKLLSEINLGNISNFKNVGKEFKNPFYDPGNKYSIPYLWGTSGLAVNRKYVSDEDPSWAILWNPEYKGKMSMLNNMQDVIGAALKYLGYSANSTNPQELAKAEELLLEQRPLLRGYDPSNTIMQDLVSEKLWAAHTYSGDGSFAAAENENIEYIIPKEGGFIWVDNFIIPVGSKHKYTAEAFINYLLRPDVSAKIANYLWYANTNEAAMPFTNSEILEDPSIYPSQAERGKLEFSGYFSGAEAMAIYNRIWANLRASK